MRSYTFHITKVVQVNNEQRVAMQFLMCKMMTSFVSSVLTKATQQQQRKMHRNDKTAAFADQFRQHCRHCLLLRSLRKAFFTRSGRVFFWPSKTALKVLKVDYSVQKMNSTFEQPKLVCTPAENCKIDIFKHMGARFQKPPKLGFICIYVHIYSRILDKWMVLGKNERYF